MGQFYIFRVSCLTYFLLPVKVVSGTALFYQQTLIIENMVERHFKSIKTLSISHCIINLDTPCATQVNFKSNFRMFEIYSLLIFSRTEYIC